VRPRIPRSRVTASLPLVALPAAAVLLCWSCNSTPADRPPTAEEKAYLSEIIVSDAHMSVTDNFLGQKVFFLDAKVTNRGTKTVRRLVLQLEFVDSLGQVVLREKAFPVTLKKPPLKPGETRPFRAAFENMPADWNMGPPSMQPISLQF
jgi:hypothetical protein